MTARSAFQRDFNVSRETMEKFDAYAQLLKKWNPAINLVAKSTLENVWTRHFSDSAQLFALLPKTAGKIVDLGSGAGFPALVLAALSGETPQGPGFTCIESDQRKAVFLQTVIRELGLKANVISERAENAMPVGADVVTARALARVSALLPFVERHMRPGGTALFLKGASFAAEIEEARKNWMFDIRSLPSITDPRGAILVLGGIRRV